MSDAFVDDVASPCAKVAGLVIDGSANDFAALGHGFQFAAVFSASFMQNCEDRASAVRPHCCRAFASISRADIGGAYKLHTVIAHTMDETVAKIAAQTIAVFLVFIGIASAS